MLQSSISKFVGLIAILLTACSAASTIKPLVATAIPPALATPTTTRQLSERISYRQGYRQDEEGVIVVHVKGGDAQISGQVNALLKNEIAAFDSIIQRNRAIQNLGCTNFAAFGGARANGRLWHGRNFDFYGFGAMDRYRVVFIVEPDGKLPFASISWPGWGGPEIVHTAMNAAGISLGYNWANSNQESIPVSFLFPAMGLRSDLCFAISVFDKSGRSLYNSIQIEVMLTPRRLKHDQG